MWILKGTLLGLWASSLCTIAYLYFTLRPRNNTAIAVDILTFLTVHNPTWWLILLGCFAFALAIARAWRIRPLVWVAVALTGLFPAGVFTIFIVLLVYLYRHAPR